MPFATRRSTPHTHTSGMDVQSQFVRRPSPPPTRSPMSSKKSVAFASDIGGATVPATEFIQNILKLETDQHRLDALKAAWAEKNQGYLDQLVQECGHELKRQVAVYCSSSASFNLGAFTALRNLLSCVGLLARREYPTSDSKDATKKNIPLLVFPGCIENLLVLLEAVERPVTGSDQSPVQEHALKYHALHAFNRLLEAFPAITTAFVPLMIEVCRREIFPTNNSLVQPNYGIKILETLGLITAMAPAAVVTQSHLLLQHALELIATNLKDIDSFTPEITSSSASSKSSAASLPPQTLPLHQFTLSLLDFTSTLLRKVHLRLPVSYPSSRMLHPRAWPFGSEELGADKDEDDEEGGDEKEEEDGIEAEDEDDDEENADGTKKVAPTPRQCFTEQLKFNPVRKGAQPLTFTPEVASDLFGRLFHALRVFFQKIGRESAQSTSPNVVNDSGTTILAFLPFIVALDNLYAGSSFNDGAAHGTHVEEIVNFFIEQLQELDLNTFHPSLPTLTHHYYQAIEGCLKYSSRASTLDFMPQIYEQLVNNLGDVQGIFPRQAFIKLRRYAVGTFMAILYLLDTEFHSRIGTPSFFTELFPLLANPLLTSHIIWILRTEKEHVEKKVLPQVMRGLLNTNTRSSPSMKTVNMILTSLGNVACFTRAFEQDDENEQKDEHEQKSKRPAAVLPLLTPYMDQLLETIMNTMEKSPSGTGQIASLVLCRIVMAGYEMSEVQSSLPRILSLYSHILDESLFVAEQAELGDDYDEDDQDLVSQLQYCCLDMLHLWFQDLKEAAQDPIARGLPDESHPFDQKLFIDTLIANEDNVEVLREIVQVLLENTKKPIFFNDDLALRNSEIHLVKEILTHTNLIPIIFSPPTSIPETSTAIAKIDDTTGDTDGDAVVLPPLTPDSLFLTLLRSILLASADGQQERKYNYLLWSAQHRPTAWVDLTSLSTSLRTDLTHTATIHTALAAPTNQALIKELQQDPETWKVLEEGGWIRKGQ